MLMGRFQLLVKRYAGGVASPFLWALPVGARVSFCHTLPTPRAQYPFEGKRSITMLAAGTGITPMVQALWHVFGTSGDDRKVVLLYGSKTVDDIMMRSQLEEKCSY